MFKTRLLSGIVLVILVIALLITGDYALLFATMLTSLIGMFELYRVLKLEKSGLAIVSYIAAILYYLNLKFVFLSVGVEFLFMGYMILLMMIYVFRYPKFKAPDIFGSFFGLFYVAIMLSYIYRIRSLSGGLYLAALVFWCSWGCDTCAYCVGMLCSKTIGTHKMAPVLSPKKSIEGAIGGVLGAALLTCIYCNIVKAQMGIDAKTIGILCVIAGIAGFISMIGDLTASAIKRHYEIKDYGKLIPGHGGILDRFDSLIITAPIIYYLAVLAMQIPR